MAASSQGNWVHFSRDAESGIELFHSHFSGLTQAYTPHWHDDYLIGYNEQGLQQFHCRHQVQRATPGKSFLIEPDEIHDGESPHHEGFTYRALYLPRLPVYSALPIRAIWDAGSGVPAICCR